MGLNVCHQQSVLAAFFFVTVQTKTSENGGRQRAETARNPGEVTVYFLKNGFVRSEGDVSAWALLEQSRVNNINILTCRGRA